MTWTQAGSGGNPGGSSSGTLTLTAGQASTAGNLLVATLANTTAANAPTLPAGWTLVASSVGSTSPKAGAWIYAYFNNPGAISSVAVTFTSGFMYGQVIEWTCPSVASVDDADQTGSATGAATSSPFALATSGNLAVNNELAVAAFGLHFSAATATTLTPGGSFAAQADQNQGAVTSGHAAFDSLADTGSSAGATLSDNESSSTTGAGNWAGVIATFDQPGTSLTLPTAQATVAAPVPVFAVPGSASLTAARVAVAAPVAPSQITYLPPVMAVTVAAAAPTVRVPASVALPTVQAAIGSPYPAGAGFGPFGPLAPALAPNPSPFPSILKCTGQVLTDENGTTLPQMKGFVVPVFKVATPPYTQALFNQMYTKGARVIRMMVYWDQLEPTQGGIDTNWLSVNLDVAIKRALTAGPGGTTGMYVWLGFYYGPGAVVGSTNHHMPAWAMTNTGLPGSCLANYVSNGQNATQTLAARYGNSTGVLGSGWAGSPYGVNGYKGVIGMGINEPTPDDGSVAGYLVKHVNQQAQMASWVRNGGAPQWIQMLSGGFGTGGLYPDAPGSGHSATANHQTFTRPPAQPSPIIDGGTIGNFIVDHHGSFWCTDSTNPLVPNWDGRNALGGITAEYHKRFDFVNYPPQPTGASAPLTSAQLVAENQAELQTYLAYCAPSYANCPMTIGECYWEPSAPNADSGILPNVHDKIASWVTHNSPPIAMITQWDFQTSYANDPDAAFPGVGQPGADTDGWQIWTNAFFAGSTNMTLPTVSATVTAQTPTITVPSTVVTLVKGAQTATPRAFTSVKATLTTAAAGSRATARAPLVSLGSRTPQSLGGTETDKNLLGGSATRSSHVYAGTATLTTVTLNGTLTRLTYAGTATGWTMIQTNLTLAEFNDEQLAVAITSGGSALNITGMEVDAFFKTAAGVPDTDPSTIKLSSPSSGVVITNAAGGLATVTVPASDLAGTGITFWRLDVVNAGLRNTALFGTVSITPL